jgi:hypothetical protein
LPDVFQRLAEICLGYAEMKLFHELRELMSVLKADQHLVRWREQLVDDLRFLAVGQNENFFMARDDYINMPVSGQLFDSSHVAICIVVRAGNLCTLFDGFAELADGVRESVDREDGVACNVELSG